MNGCIYIYTCTDVHVLINGMDGLKIEEMTKWWWILYYILGSRRSSQSLIQGDVYSTFINSESCNGHTH